MHLLETRYQRDWADDAYPQGIVRYLDDIGLLSPRLTLAHCTWTRPDELELIAERGATISANTSSNLTSSSGIAPVAEMMRRGCRVAIGLDGATLDEDEDALREMRLSHLLHVGTGFRTDVSRAPCSPTCCAPAVSRCSTVTTAGASPPAQPADIMLLDWNAVDDDRLRPDVDPLDLLFARATARHIRELIIAGRDDRARGRRHRHRLPGACATNCLARLRAGMASNAAFAAALQALERVVHPHFETEAPCC